MGFKGLEQMVAKNIKSLHILNSFPFEKRQTFEKINAHFIQNVYSITIIHA